MILGLIVLASLLMFLFLQKELEVEQLGENRILTEKVTSEMVPIKRFVEDCLYQEAKAGIITIGEHGGYDDPAEELLLNQDPTSSDAIELVRGSGYYIPYWYYVISRNTCHSCRFSSKEPVLHGSSFSDFDFSVEANLARRIKKDLPSCLDGFRGFQDEFTITPLGNMTIRPIITDKTVKVTMEYPLEIVKGKKQSTLTSFTSRDLQVDLPSLFDLAEEIITYEEKNHFLAKNTLNMIAAGSMPAPDPDRLPPIAATDFKCGPSVSWYKSNVEEKMKDLLAVTVPRFQVFGSLNFNPIKLKDDFGSGFYAQYYMVLNETSVPYAISFDYLGWPVYLDIYPSNGDILEGTDLSQSMPLFVFCMHDYEFMYDLSYPIMVTLQDPAAFDGEGYTFQFGLEANIRANSGLNSTNTTFPERDYSLIPPLFQNPDQRLSGNYTFRVSDAYTKNPLNDAVINLCIPDEEGYCDADSITLGTTNGSGEVTTRLPTSMLGLITITREDYQQEYRNMGLPKKKNVKETITMNRKVKKTIHLKKKLFRLQSTVGNGLEQLLRTWKFYPDYAEDLDPADTVTLTFTRMDEGEEPFNAVALFTGNGTTEVELIPGKYQVSATILSESPIHIPREKKCISFPWYTFKKDECSWMDPIDMDAVPAGGLKISKENRLWTLTPQELYGNNSITFYGVALKTDDLKLHEELKYLSIYQSISDTYRNALEPTYDG
ncbi:MAG: hypothetical protein GXP63_07710 [DPANN group archaeon]|nr:hypothetical protein [DPANN group archaeon]